MSTHSELEFRLEPKRRKALARQRQDVLQLRGLSDADAASLQSKDLLVSPCCIRQGPSDVCVSVSMMMMMMGAPPQYLARPVKLEKQLQHT